MRISQKRASSELIEVNALSSFYGRAHVVHDVSLRLRKGETVALLGRNGAGKTTILKSLACAPDVRIEGDVVLNGQQLPASRDGFAARVGVQLVPENRNVLKSLSVRENLILVPKWEGRELIDLEELLESFPTLKPLLRRRGNELSGGQQQLVAIARAMRVVPSVLLMDEPSAGLSPQPLNDVYHAIRSLRDRYEITVLLAEQNLKFALSVAERVIVVINGRTTEVELSGDFSANSARLYEYLGV